jgi:arylsulfatase A-like enzyme
MVKYKSKWVLAIFLICLSCKPDTPVNILFILVDDLGWKDLKCYGSTFYETPNIDQLASEGILFTNAYSASPVCSPTRASIMTGKYPTRVGITDWIPGLDPKDRTLLGPEDMHALPLEEITLAEALRREGYKTFFAGKWHLGGEGYYPENQGFDLNKGGHHRGSPPGGYYSPYENPKLSDGPEGEYLTDRLTNESLQFLENNHSDPFFLFLSFYTVHTPIQANRQYVSRFREKRNSLGEPVPLIIAEHDAWTVINQVNADYASMVYALDQNVGRLMKKLDDLNLSDRTLIIFTSDNGGLSTLPENRMVAPTSVKPLRAGKGWCYEGGIRVPLLIRFPDRIAPNSSSDEPVFSCDFYPTILELAGLSLMPDQHRDGKSMVPLFKEGGSFERDLLFWHFPHYHGSNWRPGAAIRRNEWKLIEFYDWGKTELYNLRDDPGEIQDLSDEYPEVMKELKQKLREIQEDSNAEFPVSNPAFDPQVQ